MKRATKPAEKTPEETSAAWARNPGVTLYAKDYLWSLTRERLPPDARLALDILHEAVRHGGRLARDHPITALAKATPSGIAILRALMVEDGEGFVFDNDWMDLPAKCARAKETSLSQSKKARGRWGK